MKRFSMCAGTKACIVIIMFSIISLVRISNGFCATLEQELVQKIISQTYQQAVMSSIQKIAAEKKLGLTEAVVKELEQQVTQKAMQDAALKSVIQKAYAEGVTQMVQGREQKVAQEMIAKKIQATVAGELQKTMVQDMTRKVAEQVMVERFKQVATQAEVKQAEQKAVAQAVVKQEMEQAARKKMEQMIMEKEIARRQAIIQQMSKH